MAHAVSSFVPKVHRSNNLKTDADEDKLRKAFVRVIEGMWKDKEIIRDMAEHMDALLDDKGKPPLEQSGHWAKVTTLRSLDEAWLVGWLFEVSGKTQADFEAMKQADGEALRQLMVYSLNAALSLKLPDACRDQRVCAAALKERLSNMGGGRLKALCQGGALGRGNLIRWADFVVYSLVWAEGRVKEILFMPTKEKATVPEHVNITESYDLYANYDEMQARVELPPSRYYLHAFVSQSAAGPMSSARCQLKNDSIVASKAATV